MKCHWTIKNLVTEMLKRFIMDHLSKTAVRFASTSSRRPDPLYWREAATVIVAAPKRHTEHDPNPGSYEVLMLKRGSSSPFVPNNYVYPGGCITQEDFDRKTWSDVFKNVSGLGMKDIESDFHCPGNRVEMMRKSKDWTYNLMPEVAFRICALRETFEESGLLCVSHKDEFDRVSFKSSRNRIVPNMFTMPEYFNAAEWRKSVSENPSMFHELCAKYQVVPNIWALFEWSNWLTPTTKVIDKPPLKPNRYDTIFYVCCFNEFPDGVEACSTEMSQAEWKTPEQWLKEHRKGDIKMIGPQIYESDRLTVFGSLQQLSDYVRVREPLGMIRFYPLIVVCEDDIAFLLPGDELYPTSPNPERFEPIRVSATSTEFMNPKPGHAFHRGFRHEKGYLSTVYLPCGLITNPSGTLSEKTSYCNPEAALKHAQKAKM